MTLTKYVSAQWMLPALGGDLIIKAVGDDGEDYFIPSRDTDVPPWPEYLADGGKIDPADLPDPGEPIPYVLPKLLLWTRLSDQEAEDVAAAMEQQPAKMQGIWNAATEVQSDSEFFGDLETFLTAVIGADRAAEVLAPQ